MPRGIPNEKTNGRKAVMVTLNEADYAKLVKLSEDQYRTPQLQAGYLLKQVLAQVTVDSTAATAEKILARAHSRTNGEA